MVTLWKHLEIKTLELSVINMEDEMSVVKREIFVKTQYDVCNNKYETFLNISLMLHVVIM